MDPEHQETIEALVRILRKCQSILFITGAGVSADSGLPTYRGIGGLYGAKETDDGLPIEAILSGPMFRSQPELTWKYLAQITDSLRAATYNRAHEVIALMEQNFPRVWTLTQNVDGFHHRAGSRNVIEIHGNAGSMSCTRCDFRRGTEPNTPLQIPPYCPECGAVLRPDVVLFEESLPEEALLRLRRELDVGFGAIFSIGTSSVFPYIQEPVISARRMGVPTVEINPSETMLSGFVDYRLPMGAAAAMDEIWNRLSDGR